jgi:hypothetical protein
MVVVVATFPFHNPLHFRAESGPIRDAGPAFNTSSQLYGRSTSIACVPIGGPSLTFLVAIQEHAVLHDILSLRWTDHNVGAHINLQAHGITEADLPRNWVMELKSIGGIVN